MSAYDTHTLGWWMDERRGELGLTWDQVAEQAGLSTETLYRAASGRSMRTTTKKGIERALRWRNGAVDAILAGGKPTPEKESSSLHYDDSKDVAELKQIAASLLEHVEQLRRQIDAIERRRAG